MFIGFLEKYPSFPFVFFSAFALYQKVLYIHMRLLKPAISIVLSRSFPSTYNIEYASGPSLPAASLSDGFEEPREVCILSYSCFSFFLMSSAPYRPDSNMEPKAGPMRGVPYTAATARPTTKQLGYTSPV